MNIKYEAKYLDKILMEAKIQIKTDSCWQTIVVSRFKKGEMSRRRKEKK